MGDSAESSGKLGESGVLELTGKIMVVTVMVLFLVVVFVFCLHLYAKWFLNRGGENSGDAAATTRRRRRRFDFAPGMMEMNATAALQRGLDPAALKAIPIVLFSSQESSSLKDMECAVCLSEVSDGEKVRFLPKCQHGFHVGCIDMWFESHSTCPLCRNPVSDQEERGTNPPDSPVQEGPTADRELNFPTNVLFWGDETRVRNLSACLDLENAHHHPGVVEGHNFAVPSSSMMPSTSSSNGILVIDIPRPSNEDEAQKSPLPTPTRLRSSFRRLLSRDRRISPRSAVSGDVDLEQQQQQQGS